MRRAMLCALLCALFLLPGCRKAPEPPPETLIGPYTTLEDGAAVVLWDDGFGHHCYRLEDGTDLLHIPTFSGQPWNSSVGGLEGFNGLTEEAQEAVRAYYEELGLLYDVDALLSAAYADYTACAASEDLTFTPHSADQSTMACYETARVAGFLTEVMRPVVPHYERVVDSDYTCVLFDRSTGEVLDPWSLFTLPEAEVKEYLFYDLMADWDLPDREELTAALAPEQILWSESSLELRYPAGSLTDADFQSGMSIGLDYADLREILQPWALPGA